MQHNFDCSQSQKPQERSTHHKTQIDNNKCLHKWDIAKKNKIEKWRWLAEKRKNEQDICVSSKRNKYNLGHNYEYSQSQNTQIDNNKCLHK